MKYRNKKNLRLKLMTDSSEDEKELVKDRDESTDPTSQREKEETNDTSDTSDGRPLGPGGQRHSSSRRRKIRRIMHRLKLKSDDATVQSPSYSSCSSRKEQHNKQNFLDKRKFSSPKEIQNSASSSTSFSSHHDGNNPPKLPVFDPQFSMPKVNISTPLAWSFSSSQDSGPSTSNSEVRDQPGLHEELLPRHEGSSYFETPALNPSVVQSNSSNIDKLLPSTPSFSATFCRDLFQGQETEQNEKGEINIAGTNEGSEPASISQITEDFQDEQKMSVIFSSKDRFHSILPGTANQSALSCAGLPPLPSSTSIKFYSYQQHKDADVFDQSVNLSACTPEEKKRKYGQSHLQVLPSFRPKGSSYFGPSAVNRSVFPLGSRVIYPQDPTSRNSSSFLNPHLSQHLKTKQIKKGKIKIRQTNEGSIISHNILSISALNLCSQSKNRPVTLSIECSSRERPVEVRPEESAIGGFVLHPEINAGVDHNAQGEVDPPIMTEHVSAIKTLSTSSHLQFSTTDSCCMTRSHSVYSLSKIKKNNLTRAASLPDMKLKEFTPDISVDDFDDETYRFQCSCSGLYQCSVTDLVFVTKGEGDVVYRSVPWNRRLLAQHHKKPAGPLFDIKCLQQSVCQLHLPHCEIISTGRGQFLQVAHVNDEGIEFITPHKITETHVVINITEFSSYGNVKDEDSPPDPVQAFVLLFYKPPNDPDLTSFLSVLLLPKNVVLRDVLRTRKKLFRDERYIETSPHCKLHPKQVYTLSTAPEDASVLVQPAEAEFDEEWYDNYFPSFQVILEKIMKNIKLFIGDSTSSHSVWQRQVYLLSDGVKKSCRSVPLNLPPNERLLKMRNSFIDGVSGPVVNSLLDKLLEKKVITDAEREAADEMQSRSDRARFVIDTVRKKNASSEMIECLCELDPFFCKHLLQTSG